jgi:hypothetical protein
LIIFNGWSIDDSIETFEKLAKLAFKRRKVLGVPLLSHIQEFLAMYVADGLYPAENIEASLKQVFVTEKSILDCSHAASTVARIGLPVATAHGKPSYRIFTKYNGVGARGQNQGKFVR